MRLIASTLVAAAAACTALISLPADAAGYVGGGYAYGGRPAGGYYGRPAGAYYGGRAWGGYYGRPYWGGGWGWRAGWGWAGYPGVGWGWAGYPGWGGYGYGYGWGAPPVVIQSQTIPYTYVEQATTIVDAPTEPGRAPPAPPASSNSSGAWWYWCAPAQGYYPYVERCAEAWQRVAPQVPPGAR